MSGLHALPTWKPQGAYLKGQLHHWSTHTGVDSGKKLYMQSVHPACGWTVVHNGRIDISDVHRCFNKVHSRLNSFCVLRLPMYQHSVGQASGYINHLREIP